MLDAFSTSRIIEVTYGSLPDSFLSLYSSKKCSVGFEVNGRIVEPCLIAWTLEIQFHSFESEKSRFLGRTQVDLGVLLQIVIHRGRSRPACPEQYEIRHRHDGVFVRVRSIQH